MKDARIFIAGHNGMVGSAIHKKLLSMGYSGCITKNRSELDLTIQKDVIDFFSNQRIDQVYLCAAKVGGIHANSTYPADFLLENLKIQANIFEGAFKAGIKKILFLGSSCIYPKASKQPIDEAQLLSGYLEQTNEQYAIAKIAGIKLCEGFNRQYRKSNGLDYRAIMPTNLYGPGDSYHPLNSHVIPALIRRIHEAKTLCKDKVEIWGSGRPRREFLHVDDLAEASIHIMNLHAEVFWHRRSDFCSHINVGYGKDISIIELAHLISRVVGYDGDIVRDTTKPDGTMLKLMDSSEIQRLGWKPKIELLNGLENTYNDYTEKLLNEK